MKHLQFLFFCFVLFFMTGTSPLRSQVIDDSPTRVQTTLNPGYREVGTLQPRHVGEISTSHWTLGCETIDREYTNYDTFKEYLPALGIKRIRLQAGWARTEKDPGIYDFAWLDHIIDDARSRGLEIWLETSYGNPAYPGGGTRTLAGGMPNSPEGLKAWDNWVRRMARRYKDKVKDWCVWNEPELHKTNNVQQIIDFNIRTAEVIKSEIPQARIAALAICYPTLTIIEPFLTQLKEKNKLELFQWIVYHHYTRNPDQPYKDVIKARELVEAIAPGIRLWQGESGTQSEFCTAGAISKYPWTELTQAKWDARRMLGDFGHDADSLVFTAVDMDYRTTSFHNGLMRYGLIKTAGAAQGYKVLKVKLAYYTVQNIISVFNDEVALLRNFEGEISGKNEYMFFASQNKKTKIPLFVFWDKSKVPGNENETEPITLKVKAAPFQNPVWVDTVSGLVYEIPKEKITVQDNYTIYKELPVYDAPVFVTDKSCLLLQKSIKALYDEEQLKPK